MFRPRFVLALAMTEKHEKAERASIMQEKRLQRARGSACCRGKDRDETGWVTLLRDRADSTVKRDTVCAPRSA